MRATWMALLLVPSLAAAQVPAKLGYQGRILRSDGTPESGVVSIGFKLFAVPAGGNPLWSEEQSLALSEGFYATFLGDSVAIPADLFDGSDRYLELSLSGSALSPRQRMGSVGYALAASAARQVTGGPVDAASVSVAGKAVVDSSGKLVAEVDWANLRSVPSGFADGNDDVGVTKVTAAAPLSGEGSASSPLVLAAANASRDGYLAATDWARFEAKAAGDHAHPFAPVEVKAPLSGQGSAGSPIVLGKATAAQDGYLSAADFAAFQAKAAADHKHLVSAPLSGEGTAASPLAIVKASASQDGYLAAADFAAFQGKAAGNHTHPQPPIVDEVTPGSGLATGGTTVTIKGSGFQSGAKVFFGTKAATVTNVTSTALTVSTPPFPMSEKSVVVRNPDGQSGILAEAFSYLPPGGAQNVAAASCLEIRQAGVTASGVYWIDPNGSAHDDAFQVWCDMVHAGGGWALVFNLDTNDSNMRAYSDTGFWLGTSTVGDLSAALTADYRSMAYSKVAAKEVLIWAHTEGAEYNGSSFARYELSGGYSGMPFENLMKLPAHTTVTGAAAERSGRISAPGSYSRNAGDVFIDNGLPIIINSTGRAGTDATNSVRIGCDFPSLCGTVSCNGHNVQGGYGGYHARNGGYPLTYEAMPNFGYHPGPMGFGDNFVNNKGCSESVWSNTCGPEVARLQVDFAILVR